MSFAPPSLDSIESRGRFTPPPVESEGKTFSPPPPVAETFTFEELGTAPAPGVVSVAPDRKPPSALAGFRTPEGVIMSGFTPSEYPAANPEAPGQVWDTLNTPLIEAHPPAADLEEARHGTKFDKQMMGVRLAADEFLSGMTSPVGIATLGLAKYPALNKLATLTFAALMGKTAAVDVPEQLGEQAGLPPEQRDPTAIAKGITSEVLTAGMLAGMATGHATPAHTEAEQLAKELSRAVKKADLPAETIRVGDDQVPLVRKADAPRRPDQFVRIGEWKAPIVEAEDGRARHSVRAEGELTTQPSKLITSSEAPATELPAPTIKDSLTVAAANDQRPAASIPGPVFAVEKSATGKFVITRNGEPTTGGFYDKEMADFTAAALNRGVAAKAEANQRPAASIPEPSPKEIPAPSVDTPPTQPKPKSKAKRQPVETPAEATAKVAEHVEEVKATEGQRPAKEVKTELVSRLEQAIETAPAVESLNETQLKAYREATSPAATRSPETVPYGLTEKQKAQWRDKKTSEAEAESKRQIAAAEATGLKRITIDIPGDGTFTIWNTREALGEVLTRARKLSTATGASDKTAYTTVRPTGNIPADVWVESSEPTHEVTVSAGTAKGETVEIKRKGKPVVIKGHEDKTLFLTSDGTEFRITEPRTGMSIATANTIPKLLAEATTVLNSPKYPFAESMAKGIAAAGERPAPKLLRPSRTPGTEASPEPPITGHELPPPPTEPGQRPPPADDPQFTAFPAELPEAVRFGTELLGVAIKVKQKLRALGGEAAGVFAHTDGPGGRAEIHLRADIADLLTKQDKAALMQEALEYARRVAETGDNVEQIAKERYEFLLDQAYQEAKSKPAILALKVIWHEIGHAVDWLPQRIIAGRGNLFGRVAALRDYLKHTIALDPRKPAGDPLKASDRAKLKAEAEKQLREEMGPIREIIETIVTEEPELRIVGVTPKDVTNLLGMEARETTPELYKWFAEQPAAIKKEILRKALKGVLDERLAALGKAEQVGTKRVERTKRSKVGRDPTAEEITERFRRLFREELKARNLAELATVKEELRGAIAWWHGAETMPEYFKTSTEMFAEAFSIFMNNPMALQKRAPTYARLLWNYMEARPEVARLYDQIQNEIKAGQAADVTEAKMLDSWDRNDADSLAEARRPKTTMRDFLDNVSYHMDRRFGPIYRAAKGSIMESRVRHAVGNFIYRAAEHELFLNRMNQRVGEPLVRSNLDWKDLGRYLFYKRVVEERFKIFNPYGVDSKRALNRLENMRLNLGEQRFAALEASAAEFRALYEQHVVKAMKEARLWSPELQQMIDSNIYYATFDVRQDAKGDGISRMLDSALGGNVGPHIYRQIGTVKEIKNPATATVLKSLSLLSAASRNIAKRETVQMLLSADPLSVMEAEKRWTGKRWEFVPRENDQVGTVVYMEEGKPQAFYVRKVMAEALNRGNSIDNRLVLEAVKATSALKGLFTQLNYAFWPVNFVRDTVGWIMQMPGGTPAAWAKRFPGAIKAARDSVKGRPNAAAEAALARKMLISRADPQGVWSAAENEFEVKLASYGLNPAMWAREGTKVHALVKAWNSYRELGQMFERVNKIAGMNYLDESFPQMPEWKKREIVRERAGSPDFLQRGASNPYVDFFMMFYNPWKEGLRSVAKGALENPFSFTAKASAFVIAPTVIQALAASGVFGDDTKKQLRSIPDYDLSNYLVIPLGWQDKEQGTVAYLRLPLWEPARILHGSVWQGITGRGQGLASFYGGTVPGMNALLSTTKDWLDYEIFGHNPYDSFRGKPLLDETTFAAGGWPARQELLKHTWNGLGGSIVHRFQNVQLESPPQGDVEKFLRLPIVNNALGRWVKVSNRGLDDADRQLTRPIQELRAQIRLAVHEVARKVIEGEALNDKERLLMREPYAQDYLKRTLPEIQAARESSTLRRLQKAGSREEKGAILENITAK